MGDKTLFVRPGHIWPLTLLRAWSPEANKGQDSSVRVMKDVTFHCIK